MTTKQRRGRATYICQLGCIEVCPCEVRACTVEWNDDDGRDYFWDESPINHEIVVEPGLDCVVFRGEHPALHVAENGDGILHEWADGDTACKRTRACPYCRDWDCDNAQVIT